MSEPAKPTVTVAEVAERLSERAGQPVSKEFVRRRIKSERLYAERVGHGPTAPYMLYERDAHVFVEVEAHKMRTAGVAGGYGPAGQEAAVDAAAAQLGWSQDERDAELRRLRDRDAREALLASVEAEMRSDVATRQRLEQLDAEERFEAEARELAARVRRAERLRERALEILDEQDEEG